MYERGADPRRLPVHFLVGKGITRRITDTVEKEGILHLGGVYGNPEGVDPIQYDNLRVVLEDSVVEITFYNRALALFHSDNETVQRIHRVLGALEASIAGKDEELPLPLLKAGQSLKIGRNAPCPCGSGMKYKKCCLDREPGPTGRGIAGNVLAGIHEELKERELHSLEDAQAAVAEVMGRRNNAPLEEFSGLSPRQMDRIIRFPLESPDIATFSEDFPVPIASPVMMLFSHLVEALGSEGARATAKGNLPRRICQDAFQKFKAAGMGDSFIEFDKVNKEEDFQELHLVRLVTTMSGLMRKYKGKFRLTAKGRKAMEGHGRPAYLDIFRTYVGKFNWGYFDLYPEFHIIQRSWLYSMYLLHLYGGEFRPTEFYGELFLKAFPAVQDECPGDSFAIPPMKVARCHALRVFERFAVPFGLAEMRELKLEKATRRCEVKKSPMLDDFIRFTLKGAPRPGH